jgi:hypothetical protein
MAQRYVPLDRHFSEYRPREDGSEEWSDFFASSVYAPFTWNQILGYRCTVVVGPSGTGKTEEFKQQVQSLREKGKRAFFCRLEELANLPLASTLEIGDKTELEAWLSSADDGWFFLDSVDEAKLVNINHFKRAIDTFADAIAPHRMRVRVVLSSRPHAWDAYDAQILCSRLDLTLKKTAARDAKAEEPEDTEDLDGSLDDASSSVKNPEDAQEILRVLRLAPFGAAEIRVFAKARGVEDADAFMQEVERSNADVLASRPEDLQGLIDDWRTSKRIGGYHDVVLRNVTRRIKEPNPRRQQVALLTPERALVGAERLAAAVTLAKKSSLLLPDRSPLDAKVRDELLDPKDVLLDWRPSEVQELLGCGLFDESLFGSVRFHHRDAREYLTARWLRRLLGNRKHRRSVHELLFVQPYGCEKPVVVPSLKPVAAWLALWDQKIRDAVLRVDPKVLREYGDAALLPVEIRVDMLRDFAKRYANQKHTSLSLNVREVRRLADPRLLPTIRELLEQYWDHNDVRELLLRVVREGKFQGIGELMLRFATDDNTDCYSRICAVQAIGSSGTDEEKERLKAALLTTGAIADRELFAALLGALYPTHLRIDEITALLESPPNPQKGYLDPLPGALTHLLEQVPDAEASTFLRGIAALLKRPPLHDEWLRISTEYAWLLPVAMVAAKRLISAQPNGPFDDAVLATIALAQQADHLDLLVSRVAVDATEPLPKNIALKHAVFWHMAKERRAAKPSQRLKDFWYVAPMSSGLLRVFEEADAPLFLEAMGDQEALDDRLVALSALIGIYGRAGRPEGLLEQMRRAVAGMAELEAALTEALNPKPSPEWEGGVANVVGILFGAVAGTMKLSDQAARSTS